MCASEKATQRSCCSVWGGVPTVAAAATVGIRPKVTHSFLRGWIKGGREEGERRAKERVKRKVGQREGGGHGLTAAHIKAYRVSKLTSSVAT